MDFRNLKRTFIVAEIGVNHEGNSAIAHRLIDAAADAGADAVKFQTYTPERYISIVQPDRLERVRRFALSRSEFRSLADHARQRGVIFFSTPLAIEDVEFLASIVSIFKIASGDLTYLEMIRFIAQQGKPIILSTGLGTEQEIRRAIDIILSERPRAAEDGSLMLMHCVTAYPTPDDQANLQNLRWLADRFKLPIGYSDHTLGNKACELAVAIGAVAIEKHFTDRREGRSFRDHELSADPKDLADLVKSIRKVELFLGKYARERTAAELENLQLSRRSVAAAIDIESGTILKREMLTGLRPLWGIPIEHLDRVIGRRVKRTIKAGDLLREDDIAAL